MGKYFNLKNYFDFLFAMTEKEVKARYKRAVFGFLWVVLNPILQMIIIGAIFSFFIKIPNYFLFLFSGLLPWQFFSLSLSKATQSIVNERELLQKAKFPIEAIPISIVLANFINMVLSLILLTFLLIVLKKLIFPQFLLIFPAMAWLLFLTIGVTLLTSSLNVRYRDVNFFVGTLLTLWFYATPIVYDLSIIPVRLHFVYKLNPLASIFEILHFSVLNRGVIDIRLILINLIFSIGLFGLGLMVYKTNYKHFADWL